MVQAVRESREPDMIITQVAVAPDRVATITPRKLADEIDRLQAEKETLSRELSVYMEAVTTMENAIHGL